MLTVNMLGLSLWKGRRVPLFLMRYQKIITTSNRKPNKNLLDQGSEFYNKFLKSWFDGNDIEMYWTHKERKSVVEH